MDRKRYKVPFRRGNVPSWICPTCKKGIIKIIPNAFNQEERALSRQARGHEDWEPEWVEYVYSCLLRCSNDACNEIVASSGIGCFDWEPDQDRHEQKWFDYFYVKYFVPHLQLIEIPKNTPEEIVHEMNQSFKLFFCNPSSSLNHIRIAVELILTDFKIKKYIIVRKKRHFISLHKRIDLLPSKFEHLKEELVAIKWLGNAGSHSHKEITIDDVMDAYEIMEFVLKELYEKKAKAVKKLAKKINKNKGPKNSKKKESFDF